MCITAGISRSGYYASLKRIKEQKDKDLIEKMQQLYFKHRGRLGIRRYKMELEREFNLKVNLKKIYRIKKEQHLVTKIRVQTQHKKIFSRVSKVSIVDNILNRNFRITKPESILATDVTYLKTVSGTYYLSILKDLATGEIVAHSVSEKNDVDLVIDMLNKLKFIPEIIHSDRGGIYTGFRYIQHLKQLDITRSMSNAGEPIDNAPTESFFGHFKDEVDYRDCENLEQISDIVDNSIYYYNNERPQWEKKRMTPNEYKDFLYKSYSSVLF